MSDFECPTCGRVSNGARRAELVAQSLLGTLIEIPEHADDEVLLGCVVKTVGESWV